MRNLVLSILTVTCFTMLYAAPSRAKAEHTVPNIYAGLVAGYTATVDLPEGQPDPMGPAIGVRAGLTLPLTALYVGGLFLYHTGESVDVTGGKLSSSSFMLGGEVGYELGLTPLIVRPSLGIGYHNASLDQLVGNGSESSLYLSPGINLAVALGLMVGAELRYNAILNDAVANSVSLLGTLGLGF